MVSILIRVNFTKTQVLHNNGYSISPCDVART